MSACLFETRCHCSLLTPISGTRLSFRCFDVSEHFIGHGSSSGDVFIFNRISQHLLRRVPAAPAKIDRVAFNPANDNVLCIASSRGVVSVLEHNSRILHNLPARDLFRTEVHANTAIVQLLWTQSGDRFVAGDDRGVISITDLCGLADAVLFELSPTNLLTLDSRIVQVDSVGERLAISTTTSSYLCDLVDRRFTKIGKKPRNGPQGACFSGTVSAEGEYPNVFCARPGGRLWEVDAAGEVICTLNFRHESSTATDNVPVPLRGTSARPDSFDRKTQFGKVLAFDDFLLSFTDEAFFVLQIWDCDVPRIVWQTTSFRGRGLSEVRVDGGSIFMLHETGDLTEWSFSLNVLGNLFYLLPKPEQRLTVVVNNLDFRAVRSYLHVIERRKLQDRELVIRPDNWPLLLRRPSTMRLPYFTTKTFLLLVRYFEGILASIDKRCYEPLAVLTIPYRKAFNVPAKKATPPKEGHSDPGNPRPPRQPPLLRSPENYNEHQSPTPSQVRAESVTRIAHRALLNRICRRLQKEVADSLLIELNSFLWTPPNPTQERHCLDAPLDGWGVSLNLLDPCDACGESLVMNDIEEMCIVHFCGHRYHASCSLSDVVCCICVQNYVEPQAMVVE